MADCQDLQVGKGGSGKISASGFARASEQLPAQDSRLRIVFGNDIDHLPDLSPKIRMVGATVYDVEEAIRAMLFTQHVPLRCSD
ncbi:hypothetical protein D3C84_769370 [compost metagenome]